MEAQMETTTANKKPKKSFKEKMEKHISVPLFKQSLKANRNYWLVMTIGCALIFIIINLVLGSKKIFNNINMDAVVAYVDDEGLSWLKLLGFLQVLGFSLDRIQLMSQVDLNSILNELVYKIAGVILPMIYVMVVANKLIAAQVNEGSMAYVLSTPTNRKKVVKTQAAFLALSLIVMYLCITVAALLSETIANMLLHANYPDENFNSLDLPLRLLRTLLYCLGSFLAIFALAGFCYGASCTFNKSSQSIAVGGGFCVLCFLCVILGLFGNKVLVSVGIGVQAMNFFNYITVFTLLDTESMSNFVKAQLSYENAVWNSQCFNWIWESVILFAFGTIFSVLGMMRFTKKDLPL